MSMTSRQIKNKLGVVVNWTPTAKIFTMNQKSISDSIISLRLSRETK